LAEEALEDGPKILRAVSFDLGVHLGGRNLLQFLRVVLLGRGAVDQIAISESLKLLKGLARSGQQKHS